MAEQSGRNPGDPRMLRAIAHPLRPRILDAVAASGPATAIGQLLGRYQHRSANPEFRPAGSRPVRLMAWGVPVRADPDHR